MKTLYLFSTASGYGGAEKSLEAVFGELAQAFHIVAFAEHPVHLAALREAAPRARVVALQGANTPGAWLRNAAAVVRVWRSAPPQAILSNTNKGALWAALCQRGASLPIPAYVFLRDFTWQRRRLIFGMFEEWHALAPSRAVLDAEYWRDWLPPADRTHVIPNAVALPSVPPAPAYGRETAVLCLANLSRWKGVDYLIRALAETADPEIHLIVQGKTLDAAYRAELDRLVTELGLDTRVEFRPFQDSGAAYAECSLVAVPSISEHGGPESFGRTVIEAWAHAKPVVAFACGGPGYLIRDGVDGFLVPEKNVGLLAARIRILGSEPARRHAMGQAGLRRATSDFSVASVAAALIHTLKGGNFERVLHAGREEGLA